MAKCKAVVNAFIACLSVIQMGTTRTLSTWIIALFLLIFNVYMLLDHSDYNDDDDDDDGNAQERNHKLSLKPATC